MTGNPQLSRIESREMSISDDNAIEERPIVVFSPQTIPQAFSQAQTSSS
jgi:hypothetical protein